MPISNRFVGGRRLEAKSLNGDGKMQIQPTSGLGASLDRDKVARAAEVYRKCGMRDRDDALTMRLAEPGWRRKLW